MGAGKNFWYKQLYVGSFYRPPDDNDPAYLDHLQTYLSRIPVGAHTWLGGDFTLADIDWETESVKPYAIKTGLELLRISKDHFLDQMVVDLYESRRIQRTYWISS